MRFPVRRPNDHGEQARRAVLYGRAVYAFGALFAVLALRRLVLAVEGGVTFLGTIGLAPYEESLFYGRSRSTAPPRPWDACLPEEGDLCRETCGDHPWSGRSENAGPKGLWDATGSIQSCFSVEMYFRNKHGRGNLHEPATEGDIRSAGLHLERIRGGEVKPGGRSAAEACCYFGGGRTIAIREAPRIVPAGVEASRVATVPPACRPLVATDFPSIDDLVEANPGGGRLVGSDGGKWTACTHITAYGVNFAAFLGRHLAYGLKPRSVLEFGCGLGTTSDFLARHVPGGSDVVCVEPEVMLGEVFAPSSRAGAQRPLQIAMDAFEPANAACAEALFERTKYELVLTLEVAEHLDPARLGRLADLLAAATGKYLVFSAARPKQGGTGHVEGSMKTSVWWIAAFEARGLVHLPELSRRLRWSAKPEREYDLGSKNLFAMGAPGIPDPGADAPDEVGDCDLYPHKFCPIPPKELDGKGTARNALQETRAAWLRGQAQALWPELHILQTKIEQKKLRCSRS